jgi:tetratricopeptide (TPR) repeat protein
MKRVFGVIGILAASSVFLVSCSKSPKDQEAKSLASGTAHLREKDYGRAILDFRNAIQSMPEDAEPFYQLGLAYLANGDVQSAYACFHKATELNPKHEGAQVKMAEIMAAHGDRKSVEEAAKRASAIIAQDANAEAFDTLALADYRLGNREDAEKVLNQALDRFPNSLYSSVALAKVHVARNDLKGAEQILQQAVSNDPRSPHPHVALGALYVAEQQIPEAEQQFRAALGVDPRNGPALLNLGSIELQAGHADEADRVFRRLSALPDSQYKPAHAIFLFNTGKRDAALAELEKISAADPSDREAETRVVAAYLAANRPADAERVVNANLRRNPKDVDALLLRSRFYLQTGKTDAAQADLNKAIGYRNESPEAHYLLARVYGIKRDVDQERQEFSVATHRDPRYIPARVALAQLLMRTNQPQSALNVLNDCPQDQRRMQVIVIQRAWALLDTGGIDAARMTIDPVLAVSRAPEALLVDGSIRFASKDYAGARSSAEEALRTKPDDLRALNLLFRTYLAQKQIPAGIQALREWANRSPGSAPVQSLLGDMLLAAQLRDQARAAFAAAITDDPNYHPALLTVAEMDISDGKVDRARPVLERLSAQRDVTATLMLADLELRFGSQDAAIAYFRKAVDADPTNIGALNNLAYLLVEHAHAVDEGMKFARRAQQLAPESPSTNDTLGWAYFREGDYTTALSYLSRAVENGPTPEEKYHLAAAYIKTGDAGKGKQLMEAAMKEDPGLAEREQVASDLR